MADTTLLFAGVRACRNALPKPRPLRNQRVSYFNSRANNTKEVAEPRRQLRARVAPAPLNPHD